ncbi:WcaI family glycosyltransferase [Maritalea sp.]|uniref:WcaI family glycosyltransferase n=1 Tax=Maritalea sp. TaxID=2003361 RepID=UPI003EF931FA
MKILIVGLNYAPEKVGIAVYTSELAQMLAAKGHEVHVIAAQPYYPNWEVARGYSKWHWTTNVENNVCVHRVPIFVPKNPTGPKRILHHLSFLLSCFVPALVQAIALRPNCVFCIAPSLLSAIAARFSAFLVGAKSWLHIQDFEIEAASATALLSKGTALGRLACGFENWIMARFHRVSSISPQMVKKLHTKGVSKENTIEFRNWADTDKIHPLDAPSAFRQSWNISTPHIALYSGSIGLKQGIEVIVEAAKVLAHRADITFVICGEGPSLTGLETQADGLDNIQFHDLQPTEKLNELLNLATIHLLPQTFGAADLVLPSKLTNMLASGRPVVATVEARTGIANEVQGCGLITKPGDPIELAAAIVKLLDEKDTYQKMAVNARQRALKSWSKTKILAQFEVELERLCTT